MFAPHYVWLYTIMMTTYLHNCLPSSPLGLMSIPFYCLFCDATLFDLFLHVFGCIAFIHDHTPSLSKLAPQVLRGVFVGYSHRKRDIMFTFLICSDMSYRLMSLLIRMFLTSLLEHSPLAHRVFPPTPVQLLLHLQPFPLPCSCLIPPTQLDMVSNLLPSMPLTNSSTLLVDPCIWLSIETTPLPPPPLINTSLDDLHLPFAFCVGKHSCTQHSLGWFISYNYLHPNIACL